MLPLVVEKAVNLIFYKIFVIIFIEMELIIMIKEILAYFYCLMDMIIKIIIVYLMNQM